jgi:hypothetical protein
MGCRFNSQAATQAAYHPVISRGPPQPARRAGQSLVSLKRLTDLALSSLTVPTNAFIGPNGDDAIETGPTGQQLLHPYTGTIIHTCSSAQLPAVVAGGPGGTVLAGHPHGPDAVGLSVAACVGLLIPVQGSIRFSCLVGPGKQRFREASESNCFVANHFFQKNTFCAADSKLFRAWRDREAVICASAFRSRAKFSRRRNPLLKGFRGPIPGPTNRRKALPRSSRS